MTSFQSELTQLRGSILEMMQLTKHQLEKSKEAFLNMDTALSREVIFNEARINAMELSIDRQCENIFALFNPVATDLRFVIAMMKMNSDLERIGDYASGLAGYVLKMKEPFKNEILEAVRMEEMFEIAITMVTEVMEGFRDEDDQMTRRVFQKDEGLNKINSSCAKVISELILKNPEITHNALFLFSATKKLERVGDHIKNIAEDIIFYREAEVLKHRK
ncbi:MAG: phosphate signaling complex protein PhoU [Chitinophagales bacterium]|nr:phosphate signaling complex protein PhoU [Chitinophagales bacterium]